MQNRKSVLLFLFGLSLTLWSGAVLGQQKPPTPPAPTNPAGLVTLNQAQGNPLLANPGAPRPKPVFRYSLIPYETLAPAVQFDAGSDRESPAYLPENGRGCDGGSRRRAEAAGKNDAVAEAKRGRDGGGQADRRRAGTVAA